MKKYLICILVIAISLISFSEDIRVFFNAPPSSNNIDVALIELIDSAEFLVEAHFYQMGNMDVVAALVRASKRLGSSNVKLITEEHYFEMDKYDDVFKPIKEAGIEIVTDTAGDGIDRGQCHNKICIVDRKKVWMGSYNVTENGTYKNNNNALLFDSKIMANIFSQELVQMYKDKKFSIKKTEYNHPEVHLGWTKVSTYFAPKQNTKDAILREIQDADKSIYFAIFTFTDADIKEAIMNKAKQGVKVYGVFDAFQARSSYSAYGYMLDAGMNVKKDSNKGLLHHKLMVIDPDTSSDPTVITGSYNWTSSADKVNDESTVIIKDEKIAMEYYYEVGRCYGDGFDKENGNVVEIPQQDIKYPKLLLTEVAFNDPTGDWIEFYCADDTNNGNGIDIGGYYLEDDGLIKLIKDGTIVKTGDYVVIVEDGPGGAMKDDKKADMDGSLFIYAEKIGLVSTDEQVIIKAKGSGIILDAVCWSNHDYTFSPGEEEDMKQIEWNNAWTSSEERDCVDSTAIPSGDYSIIRRFNKTGFGSSASVEFIDSNSATDWVITNETSPGAAELIF